jgi:hypothetical protein
MTITKQGSILRGMGSVVGKAGKDSQTARSLRGLYQAGRGVIKGVGKTIGPAYTGAKFLGRGAGRAANVVGKGLAKHPERALYAGIPLAIGAYKFPDTVKKHMAHSDPKQHFTSTSTFLQDVKVPGPDEKMREHMRNLIAQQNRIY